MGFFVIIYTFLSLMALCRLDAMETQTQPLQKTKSEESYFDTPRARRHALVIELIEAIDNKEQNHEKIAQIKAKIEQLDPDNTLAGIFPHDRRELYAVHMQKGDSSTDERPCEKYGCNS